MSVVDEYQWREDVYDFVQKQHDELTGLGFVGFVGAFIDSRDMFVTITDSVIDARATIDALASPGSSFYVVGADIRE